jgi:hypothetical protein
MNIDPEGDVMLLIPETHRIRVSSSILTTKSTYFKTLLGDPFAQDLTLSGWKAGAQPVEFTMVASGDDLVTLCEILHNTFQRDQTSQLPEEMDRITRVVSLASKYHCIDSCQPMIEETLQRWVREVKVLDDENCQSLVIALDKHTKFRPWVQGTRLRAQLKRLMADTAYSSLLLAYFNGEPQLFTRVTAWVIKYYSKDLHQEDGLYHMGAPARLPEQRSCPLPAVVFGRYFRPLIRAVS